MRVCSHACACFKSMHARSWSAWGCARFDFQRELIQGVLVHHQCLIQQELGHLEARRVVEKESYLTLYLTSICFNSLIVTISCGSKDIVKGNVWTDIHLILPWVGALSCKGLVGTDESLWWCEKSERGRERENECVIGIKQSISMECVYMHIHIPHTS